MHPSGLTDEVKKREATQFLAPPPKRGVGGCFRLLLLRSGVLLLDLDTLTFKGSHSLGDGRLMVLRLRHRAAVTRVDGRISEVDTELTVIVY